VLETNTFGSCKDVYGLDEPESPECVVCLTNPKDTTLLPCRHFVTCAECLDRLEKCPLCRGPIKSYLRFRLPAEDDKSSSGKRVNSGDEAAIQIV
jgi:hypothetical protein